MKYKQGYKWICHWNNNASDWRDYQGCQRQSKKLFKTKDLATQAGLRHYSNYHSYNKPKYNITIYKTRIYS